MADERETKVFHITIKSVGKDKRDKPQITCEIPDFESKWPITLSDIPARDHATLKPGDSLNVLLERQSLKKQEDGIPYSGKLRWHYFWGWKKIATAEDIAQDFGAPKPDDEPLFPDEEAPRRLTPSAYDARQAYWRDSGRQQEAAWAIREAREHLQHVYRNMPPGEYEQKLNEMIVLVAEGYIKCKAEVVTWLQKGDAENVPVSPTKSSRTAPPEAKGVEEPTGEPQKAKSGTPSVPGEAIAVKNAVTFWAEVRERYGKNVREEVHALFNGNLPRWIGEGHTWQEAWETVQKEFAEKGA